MVSRRNVYSSIGNLIGKKGEVFIYLFIYFTVIK